MNALTDEAKKIIAENITYYIDKSKMQKKDIAIKLDVTKGLISQWCSGRSMPSVEKATELADLLHINVKDFTKERTPQTDEISKEIEKRGLGTIPQPSINKIVSNPVYIGLTAYHS